MISIPSPLCTYTSMLISNVRVQGNARLPPFEQTPGITGREKWLNLCVEKPGRNQIDPFSVFLSLAEMPSRLHFVIILILLGKSSRAAGVLIILMLVISMQAGPDGR